MIQLMAMSDAKESADTEWREANSSMRTLRVLPGNAESALQKRARLFSDHRNERGWTDENR